jgi:DNA-binding CsgD family transcriptional regulator
VVVRARIKGRHEGELNGIPPTYKSVEFSFVISYEIENGKIVSHWLIADRMSLLEQLEVLQANRGNRLLLEKLTAREREALLLLKDGHSRKEIAQKLFLSEDTVRSHIRNIYEKFEVHNRAQALKLVFGI